MMRHWTLLALLLLTGCVDAPTDDAAGAAAEKDTSGAADAGAIVGGIVEGTLWLPPSDSEARKETMIGLPANFSGMLLVGELTLGSQYGPAALPATVADVLVELRGPNGDVLDDAQLSTSEPTATLGATTTMAGPHTLAILSYGGSDGQANGDYVRYSVESKAP